MRILLDNCVPAGLAALLDPHEVFTARDRGWEDMDDGPLLDRAAGTCDALVTTDRSMPFQQRIAHRPFGLVVLRARSNRLADLAPLVPQLSRALASLVPGQVVFVGI